MSCIWLNLAYISVPLKKYGILQLKNCSKYFVIGLPGKQHMSICLHLVTASCISMLAVFLKKDLSITSIFCSFASLISTAWLKFHLH